jgi:hypothetical protein
MENVTEKNLNVNKMIFISSNKTYLKEKVEGYKRIGVNVQPVLWHFRNRNYVNEIVRSCGQDCVVIADPQLQHNEKFPLKEKNAEILESFKNHQQAALKKFRLQSNGKLVRFDRNSPNIYFGEDRIKAIMRQGNNKIGKEKNRLNSSENVSEHKPNEKKLISKDLANKEKEEINHDIFTLKKKALENGVDLQQLFDWLLDKNNPEKSIRINDKVYTNDQIFKGIKSGDPYAMIYLDNYIRMRLTLGK